MQQQQLLELLENSFIKHLPTFNPLRQLRINLELTNSKKDDREYDDDFKDVYGKRKKTKEWLMTVQFFFY